MADDPTPDQPGGVIVIRSLDPAFYFLVLLDGRLGFRGTTRIEKEDDAKLPPVPTDDRMARMSTTFLRNRDTIQIEVTKGELQRSKVQADKHHWYLTGKYTEGRAEVTSRRSQRNTHTGNSCRLKVNSVRDSSISETLMTSGRTLGSLSPLGWAPFIRAALSCETLSSRSAESKRCGLGAAPIGRAATMNL